MAPIVMTTVFAPFKTHAMTESVSDCPPWFAMMEMPVLWMIATPRRDAFPLPWSPHVMTSMNVRLMSVTRWWGVFSQLRTASTAKMVFSVLSTTIAQTGTAYRAHPKSAMMIIRAPLTYVFKPWENVSSMTTVNPVMTETLALKTTLARVEHVA